MMWMIERRFKLADTHPTHPGYVTPVRSVVEAKSKKDAQAKANQSSEDAVAAMVPGPGNYGEWVGDAVILYRM